MVYVESGTTADADAVADLWVELADGQREFGSHLLADENRQTLRESIAQRAVADELLVARVDGESDDPTTGDESGDATAAETEDATILGFVTFGVESSSYEQDVVRGIVQNIYVVPDRRGEGIGSALLDAAESGLAAAGADAVSLEVMADNADARRFYRRHGYGPHRIELEKSVESDTLTKE